VPRRLSPWLVSAIAVALFLAPATSGHQSAVVNGRLGQTETLLPDGRWLIAGGLEADQPVGTLAVRDPATGLVTPLPVPLTQPRAWHTASVLPDGTVLIVGGVGTDGFVAEMVERFDPATLAVVPMPSEGFTPRAYHTATLLTDGRLLVVGGLTDDGEAVPAAELWTAVNGVVTAERVLSGPGRIGHRAELRADGAVLVSGGTDHQGLEVAGAELFDPGRDAFTHLVPSTPSIAESPIIQGSVPFDGAVDVPVLSPIGFRFSAPISVESSRAATVTLVGPLGQETPTVVVAEGGRLAFVAPHSPLMPGALYVVRAQGFRDASGRSVPAVTLRFRTELSLAQRLQTRGRSLPAPSIAVPHAGDERLPEVLPEDPDADDDTVGAPDERTWDWRGLRDADGRPRSRWQALRPLQADPGVTALAGQVLKANGRPLANVTLQIGTHTTVSDRTGRFLLTDLEPGTHELVIRGDTANSRGRVYGMFEYAVVVHPARTNVLPFTIWLPLLDMANAVVLPVPSPRALVVTTPRMPGLEVHIPAHAVLRTDHGEPLRVLSLTPIPLDRTPFPVPWGGRFFFTPQAHGARVEDASGALTDAGVRIIFPNQHEGALPAGARANVFTYDPRGKGWYAYGQADVSADGAQVVPHPTVKLRRITCAHYVTIGDPNLPPGTANTVAGKTGGDPVDLSTGLFVLEKADLVVPDVLPVALTRTYRPDDNVVRAFGVGASHQYDLYLVGATDFSFIDLILPTGSRIHYVRIAGTTLADSVLEHTTTPTAFQNSTIRYNGTWGGWELKTKDGTLYRFHAPVTGSAPVLDEIRNRHGNAVTITRDASHRTTMIASPNGRTLTFRYDSGGRVGQVVDVLGRIVNYRYDNLNRLVSVADPSGGVTEYTYDAAGRMETLKDARGIVFLRNEYDGNNRVWRQTQADNTTFTFLYTLDGNNRVTETQLTDPRGNVQRFSFNTSGYLTQEVRAFGAGAADEQTFTYDRLAPTNLLNSVTDALGRRTRFIYDTTPGSTANVLAVHRLDNTATPIITTFTYDAVSNVAKSVTDPLGHLWAFDHDPVTGQVVTIKNPAPFDATQQTVLTYTPAGQVQTVRDPMLNETRFTYDAGLLSSVRDPLLQVTTLERDAAGRLVTVRNPLGQTTRYGYDALDRRVTVLDPMGQGTTFSYDPNGNLLTISDARGSVTRYAYDDMDRVITRTDPLGRIEQYQEHDGNGNLLRATDRKGQARVFTYDAHDRLATATYKHADGTVHSTVTYARDKANRLTQVVDSAWGTITFTYDDLDRLITEQTPLGTVAYGYDDAGRRTSMLVPGEITYTYEYDTANRLTTIKKNAVAQVALAYDAASRRTVTTLPNNLTVNYALYDAASQLREVQYKQASTVLGTLTYTYDVVGNRTAVGESWARTTLPTAMAPGTYDAANRRSGLPYDDNGNLLGYGAQNYQWDARDRLASITPGPTAAFTYDPLGRRTRTTFEAAVTDYLYDGLNAVQEIRTAGTTNVLTGLAIDEVFTRTEPVGTAGMLLPDGQGSTLAVMPDAGPTPSATYTYGPFGSTTSTGSITNPVQYTGRENDGTGLYYYRARYYHPALQRFISEDPIGFAAGSPNLYAYVDNAPLFWRDPLGLEKSSGWLDGLQIALDVAGLVPGLNVPTGLASAGVSTWRGDYVGAGIAMAGVLVPGAGAVGKGARAAVLSARAAEIHGVVGAMTRRHTTIAVGLVKDADGLTQLLVASSERVLRPAQIGALRAGETAIAGAGHAETTILRSAAERGLAVEAIGASRHVCPVCAPLLEAAGVAFHPPVRVR
jgi:RHS repeat-associated protein